MSSVFVLLSASLLSFFFAEYKPHFFDKTCKRLFDLLIITLNRLIFQRIVLKNALIIFFTVLISFVVPVLFLEILSNLSLIVSFIFEVFIVFLILEIPKNFSTYVHGFDDQTEISNKIISSIISFVDNFFIPALCVTIIGVPLALVYRAFSCMVKKIMYESDDTLFFIIKTMNILYFVPSYSIVLTVFTSSIFLPYCNTKNAFEVFCRDRKKITPYWLSRVLSVCIGMLCLEIPISRMSNSVVITEKIGVKSNEINEQTIEMMYYVLFSSSCIIISICALLRLIVMWGLW